MRPRFLIRAVLLARGPSIGCRLVCAVLFAVCLLPPAQGSGQQPGMGPYLLLEGRAHELTEQLRTRGHLPALSGLNRPFRSDRVRDALSALDRTRLSPLEATWAASLDTLLVHRAGTDTEAMTWQLSAAPGFHSGSSANRDPIFQWGPAGTWGHAVMEASLSAGPVAVHTMPRIDARPIYDLRFQGLRDPWGARLSIREEAAYAVAGVGPLTLVAGRLGRNWGPSDGRSLHLTDLEYNYDQLSWSGEWRGFRVTQLLGSLERLFAVNRYLVAHRLEGPLPGNGEWALTRSHVRATRERLDLGVLNPGETPGANDLLSLELLYRPWPGGELFAHLLRDSPMGLEEAAGPGSGGDAAARPTGAYEFGIRDSGRWWNLDLEGVYTRVDAQTFRPVQNPLETYTFWNTGIGADRSDYDRVLLRATAHPEASARVGLELERHRQGAGDPRLLRARTPGNPGQDPPVLLVTRLSLNARLRIGAGGELATRWGPVHRKLRVWAPDVPEGWRLEGWLMYRHHFSTGGTIRGES